MMKMTDLDDARVLMEAKHILYGRSPRTVQERQAAGFLLNELAVQLSGMPMTKIEQLSREPNTVDREEIANVLAEIDLDGSPLSFQEVADKIAIRLEDVR